MKSTEVLQPTLADAFEVGRREGLKEAFTEIRRMVHQSVSEQYIKIYLETRLKSIHDFEGTNPFKQKE